MDKFYSEKPNEPHSRYSSYIALEKYIPPNIWKRLKRNGLNCESMGVVLIDEFVQPLFSDNPFDMRRYESAEKLGNCINVFRNFVGAHKFFGSDNCELNKTFPEIHMNQKGEWFIYKQDLFTSIQKKLLGRIYQVKTTTSWGLSIPILAAYLHFNEAKLESYCEMIPMDEYNRYCNSQKFSSIFSQLINELTALYRKQFSSQETVDGIVEKIKKAVPGWNDKDYGGVIQLVRKLCKTMPEDSIGPTLIPIVEEVKIFVRIVDLIIAGAPHLFQPVQFNPLSSKIQCVRLFDDSGKKFVMTEELKRVASVPEEMLSTRYLTTVDEKLAQELIRTRACYHGPIEFVIVQIKRTEHAAVPIRTPDKGHCKLAFDFFSDVMQDLIFGVKIFQKLKKSEWHVIEEFFKKLEHHFNPREKELYFIRMDDFKKDEITRMNFFEEYDNRPTKNNRNAKADGFTAQNLKNELVYLGFEELFPDITSVADETYSRVVARKKGQILKTSDLFHAVSHCVTIVLFERLPNLKSFVRNQFFNHHDPEFFGPLTTSNKLFNDTKWKWIDMADIDVKNTTQEKENFARVNKKLILSDGNQLFYNDSACAEALIRVCAQCPEKLENLFPIADSGFGVFLMDLDDVKFLYSEYQKNDPIDNRINHTSSASRNITMFCRLFPSKRLYLRTVWLSPMDRKENGLVFAKEAYDVILLALHQQLGDDKYFEKEWKVQLDECFEKYKGKAALNMEELEEVLELLDVDKSRITLVPDISYASAVMHQMPLNTGSTSITLLSPEREHILDISQALFKVFQEVVCDIDWSKKSPESSNPNSSLHSFHSEILTAMKKLTKSDSFVYIHEVEQCVKNLKTNWHYQKCKKSHLLTPLIKLFDCDINDSITVAFFLSECEKYGIRYLAPPAMNKRMLYTTSLKIWKARLLFLYEWNNMFFDLQNDLKSKYGDIKTLITNGIYHRTPLIKWKSEADFMTLIIGTDREMQGNVRKLQSTSAVFLCIPENHEWLKNTSWRDRTYIKRFQKWGVLDLALENMSHPTPEGFRTFQLERSMLFVEVLNNEVLENETNATKVMTEIVKYSGSQTLRKTPTQTMENDGKSETSSKNVLEPSLTEPLKLLLSVAEETSQQRNESKEEETKKNRKSKKQKSKSPVSVLEEKAVDQLETSKPSDSKDSTEKVDPFEAQRKEMDEMKQMIKILQEEVRGSRQPVGKTVPLDIHQKEVNELRIKLEHLDEKCRRTSDLCNERSRELKTTKQKLEKLEKKESVAEKKLKEIQEKEKGMPTREELQNELEKAKKQAEKLEKDKATEQKNFKKKMEQMEKEKGEQVRLLQESEEATEKLKQELESQKVTSASETELLNSRIAELESFYVESQERIQFFKKKFPPEIARNFDLRPSLEMRKALNKLRTDQDSLLTGKHWDTALKKVIKLEKMTDDPKVRNIAQYWLTDYKEKLSEFSNMVSENIKKITADQFITQSELLPMFEFPVLNDYIETETTKAQQAINEKIERECFCCFTEGEREGGWWRCPGCLKRGHQICVDEAWLHSGIRLCPLCRFEVV